VHRAETVMASTATFRTYRWFAAGIGRRGRVRARWCRRRFRCLRGWRGGTCESRRRASYSTTMSLPDTDTVPRRRGQTFVSLVNIAPSPGILAKNCWGPRTICPSSTSYAAWCHGQTSRPSSSDPPARSARRCRQRRVTAKYVPSMFPTAYGPAPVTVPGGRSATGHTVICFAMPTSQSPPTVLNPSLSTCPRPHAGKPQNAADRDCDGISPGSPWTVVVRGCTSRY